MSKVFFFAAVPPVLLLAFSAGPAPIATQAVASMQNSCSCLISHRFLSQATTAAGTDELPPALTPLGNPTTAVQCRNACAAAANPHLRSQTVATAACDRYGANAPNGTVVNAYSFWREYQPTTSLSNKYQPTAVIGTLVRSVASTRQEWRCPADWLNNENQPGGVTTDRGCKKLAGQITLATPPANGTHIGSWGFTWGNEVWAFNVAGNGGAATLHTITTPAQCHF